MEKFKYSFYFIFYLYYFYMRDHHIVLQEMGTVGTQPPTKGRAKNDVMALSPQQGPPPRQVVHRGDMHWEGSQSPVEPWLCPQERLSYKESTKNSAWDDGRPLCFFHSNQNLQLICKRWLLQFPPPLHPALSSFQKPLLFIERGNLRPLAPEGCKGTSPGSHAACVLDLPSIPSPPPGGTEQARTFHVQTAALSSAPRPCTHFTPEWAQALSP